MLTRKVRYCIFYGSARILIMQHTGWLNSVILSLFAATTVLIGGGCMSEHIMTRQGYEALREKVRKMKAFDRQAIIKEIAAAASHGDLTENAEYDAAKEKQQFVESKIKELEQKLASAKVIDTSTISSDKVVFGAVVVLADQDKGGQVTYQIVGIDEADVDLGKISISSPIGRALIGKEEGETVEVRTPGGLRSYTILEILFR